MTDNNFEKTYYAWKLFRWPLILPKNAADHIHEWEIIGSGFAVCKLCGYKHLCNSQCESVGIEDGKVCLITGVVVHNRNFCDEYSENTALEGCKPYHVMEEIDKQRHLIKEYVNEILVSRGAYKAWCRDLLRIDQKLRNRVHQDFSICRQSNKMPCLVSAVQLHIDSHYAQKQKFLLNDRQKMAAKVTDVLRPLLAICQQRFGLFVKECEFMQFVFGMVFLLRSGVKFGSYYVLPRDHTGELETMIPSESSLSLYTNFKCKCITDAENRFKYLFRSMTAADVQNFNLELKNLTSEWSFDSCE